MVGFLINSTLLGVGVAMDAFSVSVANGMKETKISKRKAASVSGLFGFCQAIMPLIGWFCIHLVLKKFEFITKVVPVIAFITLIILGGQMIYSGINKNKKEEIKSLSMGGWIVQAIATSIDALSVGFTIASYSFIKAAACSLIIFSIAFIICLLGFYIGKKFGSVLADKATVFGGIILIVIGIEIFILGLI